MAFWGSGVRAPSAPPPTPRRTSDGAILFFGPAVALAALLAARLVVAGTTGVVADEAYYAEWSRRLAGGYYDHPPGVAFVIAAGRALFGDTPLGARAGAVVLGVAGAALLLPYARDRLLLVLLAAGVPVLALGGLVATPDAPLCFGWAVALAGAMRGGSGGWLVAGLGAGLAGLGKYVGWGLWPLLFLATPGEWRKMLPGVAVTLLTLAPNLLWNAQHDWISVRFQLNHGLGPSQPPGPRGALEFLGAQVGLVSPVVFGALVAWWIGLARGGILRADRIDRLAWATSVLPVVFFAFASTLARGEANWPAPAYLGACVGLARVARGTRVHRAAAFGSWLGMGLVAVLLTHVYHPWIPLKNDPVGRLGEGEELAQAVQAWGIEPVYTTRYQEAAELSWYEGIEAYALPGVDRADQYDLWPVRWSSPALFVRPCRSGTTLASDPFCPQRGLAGVDDGGGHVVRDDAGGCWQVYVVGECGGVGRF